MAKRKKYIIDKKFQLRTTFTMIGVIFFITGVIIGIIGLDVTYNNRKLANIIEIQDNVVEALLTYTQAAPDSPNRQAIRTIAKDHYNNINTIKTIISYNDFLLIIIIAFVFIQGLILYFLMIRKTHKIAGPIYVMTNYMREIIDGKMPRPRPLRKNDELIEFYEVFRTMVLSLKEKEKP